jgi:alkane 1-monooxygenase
MNAVTILQADTQTRPADWSDSKRYLWLLSPAIPAIGVGAFLIYKASPKKMRALAWFGPLLVHAVIPVLDRMFGEDASNPPEEAIARLEQDPYYATLVKLFIPLQFAANALALEIAANKNTPWLDRLGMTVSLGVLNAIAFNTSHELSHKHGQLDRFLSKLTLAPTAYTHFCVEHPMGHHKRVATPEDPASSQLGESFWEFLPRTVKGGIQSALEIERRRLKRRGESFWSLKNELLQGWGMTAAFWGTSVAALGPRVLPALIGQAVYSSSLFEVINYVEHYGLKRQKTPTGQYERTKPEHSWNSNRIVTNLVLYQLQRHSDHHAYPTRSYQALRHFENTPQLPSGYASMLLPAYIPSLWFKLMDQRVLDHYQGDLNKANIAPKHRHEIFKKFGLLDSHQ